MSSIQQQYFKGQSFDINSTDPMSFNQSHHQYLSSQLPQIMTIQQLELERIRQVQQQAVLDQQKALIYQQMMYYQQQQHQQQQQQQQQQHRQQITQHQLGSNEMMEYMTPTMNNYSPNSQSPSPPPASNEFNGNIHGEVAVSMGGKAQRRAEHNAIERYRRECLNTKFQQLAHSLPNLQNDRRPSKGTIIERTLEYVKQTVQKEQRFQSEIDKLRQANENLISKMTSEHFDEQEEDEYEDDEIEDASGTPDCEDNMSSRSSVTSNSSQHMYAYHDLSQPSFEKHQDPMKRVTIQI